MKLFGWICALICLSAHTLDVSTDDIEDLLSHFVEGVKVEKNVIPLSKTFSSAENGKVERIHLNFDSYSHPDLPGARSLILSIVNGLLTNINSNERIRPLFITHPFPIENVEVRIKFVSKNDDFTYPKLGNIAYVSIVDGIISYETLNSYNYQIEHLRSEDYPQAQLLEDRRVGG